MEYHILKLTVVLATHTCEYTKIHWAVYFKWVNYSVCEFYLSKAVKSVLRVRK